MTKTTNDDHIYSSWLRSYDDVLSIVVRSHGTLCYRMDLGWKLGFVKCPQISLDGPAPSFAEFDVPRFFNNVDSGFFCCNVFFLQCQNY
jgi:hypothetical protein